MHSLPEYLVDYLNEIAKDEGFVEHSLHFESGSNHGDGFIAAMVAVTIKGKRMADYENEAEVSLMCKLLPDNKARREFFKSTLLFEREVCVYKELLPMFSKFQLERNISMDDGFFEYPKCYLAVADATKNHYVIIMENVKVCGYELWDKRKPVDFHTSSIFLKTLGRFHGLSLALRDQEPELFQKLIALKDIMNAMMDSPDLVNFVKDAIEKAIGILIKEDEVNLLRYINDNYIHLIRTLFATNGGSGAVLIHGDCWNNNFCFLSDTNVRPSFEQLAEIESLDEHSGRSLVKLALGGTKEWFNEFMIQPVSKAEYAQYGKVLNHSKYEEYKKKQDEKERLDSLKFEGLGSSSKSMQRHSQQKDSSSSDYETKAERIGTSTSAKYQQYSDKHSNRRRNYSTSDEDEDSKYSEKGLNRHLFRKYSSQEATRNRSIASSRRRSHSSDSDDRGKYSSSHKKTKSKKHFKSRSYSKDQRQRYNSSDDNDKHYKKKTKKSKRPRSRSRDRR